MQQQIQEKLLCPLCENTRRPETLVCFSCYQAYRQEAVNLLMEGTAVSPRTWTTEKLQKLLSDAQQEFAEKQKEFTALSEATREEAAQQIQSSIKGGVRMPEDVIREAIKQKKDALWKERGGNRLFAQMKTLQAKMERFETAIERLTPSPEEDTVAQEEASQA